MKKKRKKRARPKRDCYYEVLDITNKGQVIRFDDRKYTSLTGASRAARKRARVGGYAMGARTGTRGIQKTYTTVARICVGRRPRRGGPRRKRSFMVDCGFGAGGVTCVVRPSKHQNNDLFSAGRRNS